jgi:hypothetical protein
MQLGQAFPWDTAPRYLLRDRDRIYGDAFRIQTAGMQITEVLTAPQAPWQSPYVERLIGSIRRGRNVSTTLRHLPDEFKLVSGPVKDRL